jgi:Tfp pilus assembly protein PilN
MNSDINLLERRKNRIGILRYEKLRLLRFVAISLLFLTSTLSVILFLLISFSPLPQLKRQEEQGLSTLSQFHPDMAKIYLVNERMDSIKSIIGSRRNFDEILDELQNILPSGIKVDALSIDRKNISLSVSSGSLELIDTFINNVLKSVQEGKDFTKVTLSSLSVDSEKHLFLLTVTVVTL